MQRRGFLGAMLAAGMAPAVVRSGVLMPVRPTIITDVSMTIREYLAFDHGTDEKLIFRRWLPYGDDQITHIDAPVNKPMTEERIEQIRQMIYRETEREVVAGLGDAMQEVRRRIIESGGRSLLNRGIILPW